MSFVLLGILNSQASGAVANAYFLSVLGSNEGNSATAVAVDSKNNMYVGGLTNATDDLDFLLVKYDSVGALQWQRTLGNGVSERAAKLAVDASNNIYLAGRTNSIGQGGEDFVLAKYDSSGTLQWQKLLGGADDERPSGLAIDSNNDIYLAGTTSSAGAGNNDFFLAKYNSSGVVQWQRTLGTSETESGEGLAIDSSDNIYISGNTRSESAGGPSDFLLAKYDSSGNLQWQRVLGGSSFEDNATVAIDSNDNPYIFGRTSSIGDDRYFFLAKYNPSGAVQFQRILGGGFDYDSLGVAIDSSDNIYGFGWTTAAGEGARDWLLAKWDSSGTIQFQRVLGSTETEFGNAIAVDNFDNLCLVGSTPGTSGGQFLTGKLPNDGSLEGTYSLDGDNFVYQASTLTAATASLTAATPSLTSSSASLTEATSTLTSASASFAVVTLDITP